MTRPHVYILTFCPRIELLYGATLVFKTLRTGFPNSPIHVADAASLPAARVEIQKAARDCGAEFMQFQRRSELYDFMHQAIDLQRSGLLTRNTEGRTARFLRRHARHTPP